MFALVWAICALVLACLAIAAVPSGYDLEDKIHGSGLRVVQSSIRQFPGFSLAPVHGKLVHSGVKNHVHGGRARRTVVDRFLFSMETDLLTARARSHVGYMFFLIYSSKTKNTIITP